MSFTLGLLEQLLEDMSSISDEFQQNNKTEELNGDLDKILAFIRYNFFLHIYTCICIYTYCSFCMFRVFSTVTESAGKHLSPKSSSVVSWPFLSNALMTIIQTLLKCLHVTVNENIIEAGKIMNSK